MSSESAARAVGAASGQQPTPAPSAGNPEMMAGDDVPLMGNTPAEAPASSPRASDDAPGGDDDRTVTPACPASATATPGDLTQSITVGGLTRSFIRHVPPGYTGKTPVPVVIDLHPRGASAASWRGATGWQALADAEGFIVVWPDGVQNSWNVGKRCCGPAHDQNVDDVAFARALIATLSQDACVDARRVFATGCSNGGGLAYHLACSAADVIAAVAPVDFDCTTGPTNDPSCGSCTPSRPISETQFRGTNDQVVPYAGGVSGVNPAIVFPGGPSNLATWGQLNACSGTPEARADNPSCQSFPTCGAGVDTTLCTIQGGTHCGSYDRFDIASVAWQAFLRSPMP